MTNLTDLQFGRELKDEEILRINFIIKRWAKQFIASADKDSLYPERKINLDWKELDHDWFLFPNPWKVSFTTGTMVGYEGGGAWGMDEYGRVPGQPEYDDQSRRDFEFRRFDETKKEWAKRRFGKSSARVIDQMRENTLGDLMMNRYLQEAGFLTEINEDIQPL